MIFWYTMHSLFWAGPASRSDELTFPLNLVAKVVDFLNGGSSEDDEENEDVGNEQLTSREGEDFEYLDEGGGPQTRQEEIINQPDRIYNPPSFLSQISLHNWLNFISNPNHIMLQFFYLAMFVSSTPTKTIYE